MNQLIEEKLNKVLELLKLPQDTDKFTGQVNQVTRYSLVENRLIDKTNVNELFKKQDKITSTFSSVPTTVDLGAYTHNLLSNYIHSYGYDPIGNINGSYRFNKDGFTFEYNGQNYTIGWGEVNIIPTSNGFDMVVENEPWSNLNSKISITRLTQIKTGMVTIIPSKKQVTVTNVKTSIPTKDYPSYTQEELTVKTGWDEYQIAQARKTVFHLKTVDVQTHCVALGTDIEISDTKLKGVVYINGEIALGKVKLISSFNKPLADFVTRWKVYHPSNTTASAGYGTALPVIEDLSTADNTINIIKGTELKWNSNSRTLTYIEGTKLIFDFEFLPAQGKNETWGSTLDLDNFDEDIFN